MISLGSLADGSRLKREVVRLDSRVLNRDGKQRSYCGETRARRMCIMTGKIIPNGDLLLEAIPIGGLCLLDGNEADGEIIAGSIDLYGKSPNPPKDGCRDQFIAFEPTNECLEERPLVRSPMSTAVSNLIT